MSNSGIKFQTGMFDRRCSVKFQTRAKFQTRGSQCQNSIKFQTRASSKRGYPVADVLSSSKRVPSSKRGYPVADVLSSSKRVAFQNGNSLGRGGKSRPGTFYHPLLHFFTDVRVLWEWLCSALCSAISFLSISVKIATCSLCSSRLNAATLYLHSATSSVPYQGSPLAAIRLP